MSLNSERIDWLASPPLAPDDVAVDVTHLQRATFGDAALEHEILVLFERQSQTLLAQLQDSPVDGARLAHTLKGSALAIGAFGVANAAEEVEFAFRDGASRSTPLRHLRAALTDARDAIAALLRAN